MANRFVKSRRGTQAEPVQSAEFYRQLAESLPQMLWTARPDGSAEYFNARVLQYTGRTHRQLEDWGWRAMVHADDWERCLAHWARAFKKGQPYEVEYRLRRRDGRYLWHLGAAMPLREGGRIVRWVGTSTEIENQKRAERLLEKARGALQALVATRVESAPHEDERWRSMMMLSADFFWETDAEHRFSALEPGGRFAPPMMVSKRMGKTRWETPSVLPDAAGWEAHRETLAARRAFRNFETARAGDDGVVRHYSVDGEPVFGKNGEFTGYRGVGREITARKLAERALRESNRQLRAFLDSMPAIAWIKDSKFRYLWLSASYSRLHGKTLQEVVGRDDFEIWPPELARVFRKDDELALRVNGPMKFVESAPFTDGTTARWLVVKFPLLDATGAPGVAGIGFDITDGYLAPEHVAERSEQDPVERLSARERQVLQLIVDGHTSAEVGRRLGLSPKSVDTYRSRLMAKLGIEDLPSLVKFALRHGLTTRR